MHCAGLATDPEILLFDEPTSALDPTATARIEELMARTAEGVTIIVTHNMQQAARFGLYGLHVLEGEVVEFGNTEKMFTNPSEKQTEDYVTGRCGEPVFANALNVHSRWRTPGYG